MRGGQRAVGRHRGFCPARGGRPERRPMLIALAISPRRLVAAGQLNLPPCKSPAQHGAQARCRATSSDACRCAGSCVACSRSVRPRAPACPCHPRPGANTSRGDAATLPPPKATPGTSSVRRHPGTKAGAGCAFHCGASPAGEVHSNAEPCLLRVPSVGRAGRRHEGSRAFLCAAVRQLLAH